MISVIIGRLWRRCLLVPTLWYNKITNHIYGRQWFNEIDRHTILGALPHESHVRQLTQKHRTKGIVSLVQEFEYKAHLTCPIEDLRNVYNLQVLRIPVKDYTGLPTIPECIQAVSFIFAICDIKYGEVLRDKTPITSTFMSLGRHTSTVYIHCKAGRYRSATIELCYILARYRGLTLQTAKEYIRAHRSHVIFYPSSSAQDALFREFYTFLQTVPYNYFHMQPEYTKYLNTHVNQSFVKHDETKKL
ncbi:hypothetical protein SNEBB_006226 [Seison nebaliae]|nr:hypothetical protein SNEBB_006226 [Seison nebaliae]